jgi:aminoglycoside phosphotransferase
MPEIPPGRPACWPGRSTPFTGWTPPMPAAQRRRRAALLRPGADPPVFPGGKRPPAELFRELEAAPPPDEDVFCHGDFCLPNVLFEKGALTGLVDLSDAGAGNRHLDLAACIRSLRRNFGEERYVDLFIGEYGRDRVDPDQLAWFDRLEAFF